MCRRGLLMMIGLSLVLASCNPKPMEEEKVVEPIEEFVEIENPEKMFTGDNLLKDTLLYEAIEKMMKYYETPITQADLKNIRKNKINKRHSYLDLLQLAQNKGFPMLPIYSDFDEIEEAVLEGKPVYAEFTLIGTNVWNVIFYGYSNEQFAYMDIETGEKKSVDRNRLATVDLYKALIPYKEGETTTTDLEKSAHFLDIAISDAFNDDNREQMLKYLNVIERENLQEDVYQYDYLKMYYYTFYDFQPELVESILNSDSQLAANPAIKEIAIKIAEYNNENDKLKSYLAQLQLLPFFRNETLETIIKKGTEFGYTEIVTEAEEMLNSRTE